MVIFFPIMTFPNLNRGIKIMKRRKSKKTTNTALVLEVRSEGAYSPLFVRTENKLFSSDYREAVERVTAHIDKSQYRCLIDFILIEFFPCRRKNLLRFYEGKGESFRDHPWMTPLWLEFCDRFISDIALTTILHFDRCSWGSIVDYLDSINELPLFSLGKRKTRGR